MKIVFNKIFIVESIADTIDNEPLKPIGNNLYRAIDDKLIEMCQVDSTFKSLSCKKYCIAGKESWINAFHEMADECQKNDCKPIIHLICHGTEKGIILADADGHSEFCMEWEKVLNYFEIINIMCHNYLHVTMCVCKGFWSMTHLLDEHYRIPFCTLLSSPDSVDSEEVGILLPTFYMSLFKDSDINAVMRQLNRAADYIIEGGAQVSRWFLKFSSYEFTKAARADYEKRSTLYRIRKMAKKAFRALGFKRISERMIKDYIGQNFKKVPNLYEEIRDYKFMFDIFPEERERFEFPQTFNDLRKLPLGEFDEEYGHLQVIRR